MAYQLVWEINGVYWKYSGKVTGLEIVKASTSIYGDTRFDTLKYKFIDFIDAEAIEIDKSQLALIAYQHRAVERSNPYIKIAILLKTGHKVAHEFASFFSKSSWEIKVFTDIEKANKWVGR